MRWEGRSLGQRLLLGFLIYGIGKPIKWTYMVILGWWLNPLMASRSERKFRSEVRAAFSFLFDEFGAQFVPYSEKSLYWDRATFTVRGLLFRVSRMYGDCEAEIAPAQTPTSWESLYSVIDAIDFIRVAETGASAPRAPLILGLTDIAQWVKQRLGEIVEAFSPGHYAATLEAIEKVKEIERQKSKESQAEWNERVKFHREHPEANPYKEKKQSGPIQSLGLKDL